MRKNLLLQLLASLGLVLCLLSTTPAAGGQPTGPDDQVPGQSSTLLPDGRRLLVGGEGANGSRALLVDPAKGETLVLSAQPQTPRTGHTASLLPDGRVLVFGGIAADGAVLSAPELFVPDTGEFQALEMPDLTARAHHTATLLIDGRVQISGGVSGEGSPVAETQIWDPRTGAVETLSGSAQIVCGQPDAVESGNSQAQIAQGVVPRTSPPTDAPQIEATCPPPQALDRPLDTLIGLRFSVPMQVTTLNPETVTLIASSRALALSVPAKVVPAESGRLLFVTPLSALLPATQYTLFIRGARDLSGRDLPFSAFSFTTEALAPQPPVTGDSTSRTEPTAQSPLRDTSDGEEWVPAAAQLQGDWQMHAAQAPLQNLTMLQAPEGMTALAGQVLLLNGKALPNVTLTLGRKTATTDADGRFLLPEVPSGRGTLLIDGSTADAPGKQYGTFEVLVDVRDGGTNVLPYTIWMTRLDSAHATTIPSPTTDEVVLTTPRIPGLELHLPKDVVIKDRTGNVVTQLRMTPIPVDRPPFPLPPVDVPVYFTVQPGGAYLQGLSVAGSQGARLVYPNYQGLPRGAKVNFWNYDARDKGWYIYGQGTVTPDGTQLMPDPGVVVYELSGAMVSSPAPAPPVGPPPGGCPQAGDPVDCATGLFLHTHTDLRLEDVIPLKLTRTYRPNDIVSRAFGIGANDSYDLFLVGDMNPYTYQDLILPDGGRVHFARTSPGTGWTDAVYTHTATPSAWQGATIQWVNSGPGNWKLTLKNGTVMWFPEAAGNTVPGKGAVTGYSDRNGNTLTLTRDNAGNLTRISSPNNRWIALTYDAGNRITQASDNLGRAVTYAYDSLGRLQRVTAPDGSVESYTYDASHRMLSVTNARGIVQVQNSYDANGRVIQQTLADGAVYQFAYANGGTAPTSTRWRLNVTAGQGWGCGIAELVLATSVGGGQVATGGTASADATYSTYVPANAFDGNASTFWIGSTSTGAPHWLEYDFPSPVAIAEYRISARNDAYYRDTPTAWTLQWWDFTRSVWVDADSQSGQTWTSGQIRTYDIAGAGDHSTETRITDPQGGVRDLTFNASGYLTAETLAYGTPLAATYTDQRQAGTNLLLAVTDPLGRQTTYGYDALGNLTSTTHLAGTPDAATETRTYDPVYNQLTSVTNALGNTTSFSRDSHGNLVGITDPLGNTTTLTYNLAGQPLTLADPLGNTTQLAYSLGDLTAVTDPLGDTTSRIADGAGRIVSITDPLGHFTRYDYDAADRVTGITDALGGVTALSYDPNGNLLGVTDPRGNTNGYSYDSRDRLAGHTDPLLHAESYHYDGNGNLLQHTDRNGQTTNYAYDLLNRRTTATYADASTVAYSYDAANRLTAARDSQSGTITRAYDARDRLVQETSPNGTVGYTFDAVGRRTTMTVAGQPTVNYGYDADSRPTTIVQGATSVQYAYDADGRRAQVTLPNGIVATYGYAGASRLTGITYTLGTATVGDVQYGYDAAGHRVAQSGSLAQPHLPAALGSAGYDAGNRLTQWDATSYTYDANGDQLTDGTNTYTWNARNQLAAVSGAATAMFTYDAFGRRSAKSVGTATTAFLYDGQNIVQELAGATPSANLLTGLGIDEVLARTTAQGTAIFLTDALGSTLALTDTTGALQTSYRYDPYGATTAAGAPSDNAFRYTGRENDGFGPYYYRARYYNPTLGRFISEDPIGLVGGINTYAYVGGDPISRSDPFGLLFTVMYVFSEGMTMQDAAQAGGTGTVAAAAGGAGAAITAAGIITSDGYIQIPNRPLWHIIGELIKGPHDPIIPPPGPPPPETISPPAISEPYIPPKPPHLPVNENMSKQLDKARHHYKNGDIDAAIAIYSTLAELGHAESQIFLGCLLADGRVIPKDTESAAHWLKRAALSGSAAGAFYYARYLTSIERHADAFDWYRAGATKGSIPSVFRIGYSLLRGKGVAVDVQQGYLHLWSAAKNGHVFALREIGVQDFLGRRGAIRRLFGLILFLFSVAYGVLVAIINVHSDRLRS